MATTSTHPMLYNRSPSVWREWIEIHETEKEGAENDVVSLRVEGVD